MDPQPLHADALPVLVTPGALQAARDLYRESCELYPPRAETIRGVAVDANMFRAHIVRTPRPILLPWELYVPASELHASAEAPADGASDIPAAGAGWAGADAIAPDLVDAWLND